ncbi:hypothetical protein F5Y05DRAFT_253523 [Hypoxylon sp. FL0543]|nr:hypothetical protein F5Y05DRAFT_253523 [Hypoxylon sp. FL0543]
MSIGSGDTYVELAKRRAELKRLREENKRLRTYLAIAKLNLEDLARDRDIQAQEGWVSRRARKRREREEAAKKRRKRGKDDDGYLDKLLGQPSPTRSEVERKQDALDRKIASYKNRVRRTSVQLLVAAAAGHQWREINLATRQGHLIEKVDPGAPRQYRAFDARRTSSLSSTEAAARAVKHWLEGRRRGKLHRAGSFDADKELIRKVSLALSTAESSPDPIVGMARAVMARANSMPGEGDWADKVMAPIIGQYMGELPQAMAGQATPESNAAQPITPSREPYRPNDPSPDIYTPKLWKPVQNTNDISWLSEASQHKLKNPPDYVPVGWMTWKETEKKYPTLDSIFKMEEKPLNKLWDPDRRNLQELKMPFDKRPRLEADTLTMLSLERRRGFERREMNPLYEEYRRLPVRLPAKLRDEEMRRGPLPAPLPLPLEGPSGQVISLIPPSGERKTRFPRTKRVIRKRSHEDYLDDSELPEAKYHYPIDSPAVSSFRFPDGRRVSDIMKPGPLDEPGQLRGSEDAKIHGKSVEKQEVPFKRPYAWEGTSAPLPPDFKPPGHDRKLTEDERKEWEAEIERVREEVRVALNKTDRKTGDYGLALPRSGKRSLEHVEERPDKVRENNSDGAFWHYEDMSDRDSHVHLNKKVKTLGSNARREPAQEFPPSSIRAHWPLQQPGVPAAADKGDKAGGDHPEKKRPAREQPKQQEPEQKRRRLKGSEQGDFDRGSSEQKSQAESESEPESEPENKEELTEQEIDRYKAYSAYKKALMRFLYAPEKRGRDYGDKQRKLNEAEARLKRFWIRNGEEMPEDI